MRESALPSVPLVEAWPPFAVESVAAPPASRWADVVERLEGLDRQRHAATESPAVEAVDSGSRGLWAALSRASGGEERPGSVAQPIPFVDWDTVA